MAKKNNKDKSLTNQYIRAIENPDSIGFRNGRWYQSSISGDDTNSRGFGIDIKYNKGASELAKNRDGKYLTEEEERALRNKHIDYVSNILYRNTPPVAEYPSEIKQAMAKGLLYRGDGIKTILNNSSLQEAYLHGTDDDFEKAVADYYKDKGLGERARLHTDFVDSHKPIEDKQIDWFSPAISVPMFSTLPEVVVTAKYPHEQRVIDTMNASNAEFMNRLRNNDRRAIHNQDGSYSTHVLGSADNIVFPAIQDVNGELKDYRELPWQRTLDKAIQNNDYIEFPTEGDARYFGKHYKKYFPEYFGNQYADGGEMDAPKHWNELSMADKSDAIASAVRNGVTTLEDIRKAWNDYADSGYREDSSYRDNSDDIEDNGNTLDGYDDAYQEETHEYLKGGYKPSAAIKNRIANWEGSSMQTNRSFEAEAKDFWNAIPSDVKKGLTQQQADALYSYSYNVGAGNFKKRVVPSLERYFNGKGSIADVQNHMYATKDNQLRGLAKRRAEERAMFAGKNIANAVPVSYNNAGNIISTSYSPLNFDVNNNFQTTGYLGPVVNESTPNRTKMLMDALEDEPKQQTIVDDTPEPQYNSLERLQNIYRMFGLDDYANEIGKYNPFASLTFSKGGRMHRYDGNSEDSQQMHINQMPKNPTIYRTAEGGFTTASGHPVEELGWNEDGYMKYRDTVTGDLGTAFEPSEAYTKYLIPQELTAKIQNSEEKPLEAVYPEFDVITAGGLVKDAAKLATEKAIEKLAQNKTVRNSITSLMMDTQSRMPFGSTYNEGRTLLNPYFEDYLESNIMRSNGYSNPLINLNPDGSWNMQKITDDIQTGSRDAIDFLGSTIKEQADKHNMELAKRLGYKFFDPYKEGAKRASVSIKPDVVTLTSSGDPVLGSIYIDSSDPKLDQMGLNLFGDLRHSTYHEQLHRGFYGMAEKRTLDGTPEMDNWYLNNFKNTRQFYQMKQEKLLAPQTSENAEAVDYLSKDGEAYVNAMEIGRRMGIKPGAKWPGRKEALKKFEEFAASNDDKVGVWKGFNWKNKPRRIWDAITGRYAILPFSLGLGAATTTHKTSNHE